MCRGSHAIAFERLVWTSIAMLLPTSYPLTKENFNYTFVVVIGVLFVALVNWSLLGANKSFKARGCEP